MTLPITSILAAYLAIIALPLAIHVTVRRAVIGFKAGVIHKAAFGDAGDPLLRNSIRAFGNFIEYVPLALLLFALLELQGAPDGLIWGLGVAFVVGRVIHGVSMTFIPHIPPPRALAMVATYTAYAVSAWWLLRNAL